MLELLRDLYAHQSWADAEHWNAFTSHPIALQDENIWKRLHHFQHTQEAFLTIVSNKPLDVQRFKKFTDAEALKEYTIYNHARAAAFLEKVSENTLRETVLIPWFKDPQIRLTVTQALIQATMHSQYHRGQNATRPRELGGQPPMTDFIFWFWKGKPEAKW